QFAQGHSAKGRARMYAGRAAEALEAFAIAKRLDPHSPSIVLHFLAQANFSLGRYADAAEHPHDPILLRTLTHSVAFPRAGEFQPGTLRGRRGAPARTDRPHPRHRFEPHAARRLLWP